MSAKAKTWDDVFLAARRRGEHIDSAANIAELWQMRQKRAVGKGDAMTDEVCEICGEPATIVYQDTFKVNMNTAQHDTGMWTILAGDTHWVCDKHDPHPQRKIEVSDD